MNWFEKLVYALQFETAKPKVFGAYHLCALLVIIALAVLVVVFRKKISTKFINIVLLTMGIVLLCSEAVKQVLHSMDVENGIATWSYSWRNFPFQFCSVPMYLMLLAGILRKGKVYNVILCFLATFALFGGLSVIVYPSTVLSSHLYYSIHTMVWHGSMFIIGVMLLCTQAVELKFKSVWKACIVFSIIIVLAQAMNFIWHFCGDPEKTFSMFYISPYYKCDIPVLSTIKAKAPYIVFFISYLIGFTAVACLMMAIAIGINKLHSVIINKRNQNKKLENA